MQHLLVSNSWQSPCLRLLSAGIADLTLWGYWPCLPGGGILSVRPPDLWAHLFYVSHQSLVFSAACFSGTRRGPGLEEQLLCPGLWGVSLEIFLFLISVFSKLRDIWMPVCCSTMNHLAAQTLNWQTNFKGSSSTHGIGLGCLGNTYQKLLPETKHQVPRTLLCHHFPSSYRIVRSIACVLSFSLKALVK